MIVVPVKIRYRQHLLGSAPDLKNYFHVRFRESIIIIIHQKIFALHLYFAYYLKLLRYCYTRLSCFTFKEMNLSKT